MVRKKQFNWESFIFFLILLPATALCLACLPMPLFADDSHFTMLVTPGEKWDPDCKYFDVSVIVEGFGIFPLDDGVCSGQFDIPEVESTEEQRQSYFTAYEKYKYIAEQARYGVDTSTINVLLAGDKLWLEWKTIPQGSGLHTKQEYRIYQKGFDKPRVARNIKVLARGGWSSRVDEQLFVRRFAYDLVELQVDSSHVEILQRRHPLSHWSKDQQGFVAEINLSTNVIYRFDNEGSVNVQSAQIFYAPNTKESQSDIANYFHVDEDDLMPLNDGRLEITLDNKRYRKLFAPIRDDMARSIHELIEAGPLD